MSDAELVAFLKQYGPWITAPLMCIGLFLLGYSILNVISIIKKAEVLRVPLMEEQDIEIAGAGPLLLCGEGPLLTSRFARLKYELHADDGTPIPGSMILFRTRTSGFSWVRMSLRQYDIPAPGRYALHVLGLGGSQPEDDKHWIVFMRPHLAKSIVCVLGMILGFGIFVVDLVFFVLSLLPEGSGV